MTSTGTNWQSRITGSSPYQRASTLGSKAQSTGAYQKTSAFYGKAKGFTEKYSMVFKVLLVFLTLVGAWGFGSYQPPRFFSYIASEVPFIRVVIHFVMLFILAYQGLGGTDFWVTLIATIVFFVITEIIKLIENAYWSNEEKPVPQVTSTPTISVVTPDTPPTSPNTDDTPAPAVNDEPTQENFAVWRY